MTYLVVQRYAPFDLERGFELGLAVGETVKDTTCGHLSSQLVILLVQFVELVGFGVDVGHQRVERGLRRRLFVTLIAVIQPE